jgi:hypothetical protein
MKKLLIDEAPGKNFIAHIKATGDPDTLGRFIKLRLDWHGYPIIHDRFLTYSIFDDLQIDTLTEGVPARIFDFLLNTLSDTLSDIELSAWIFLLNLLREKRPIRSLADSTTILHSLMAHEKRISELKTKDGNLSFWFYQLRNFLLFENVRHTPFEAYTGDDVYPEDCEELILESYKGALKFDKCLAYNDQLYWIWRAERGSNAPESTPIYLRAIVKSSSGEFKCYGYMAPPEFDIPSAAIVKRIEGTEFQIGNLYEIK